MGRLPQGACVAGAFLLVAGTAACQADRALLPWTRPPGSAPGSPLFGDDEYWGPPFNLMVEALRPADATPDAPAVRFEVWPVKAGPYANGSESYPGVAVVGSASRGTLEDLGGNAFVWRAPSPAAGTDATLRFVGTAGVAVSSADARVRIDAAGAPVVTGWAIRSNAFPAPDSAVR